MTLKTRTIISIVCGIATSIISILLIHRFKFQDDLDLYNFNFILFIPIGSCICGTLALSGFSFGYVFSKTKPDRLYLNSLIIGSFIVPIVIYFFDYLSLHLDNGKPIYTLMSFPKYLGILFSESTYSIGSIQIVMNIGHKIGIWGYLIAFIQLLGFFLGGLITYMVVKLKYSYSDS